MRKPLLFFILLGIILGICFCKVDRQMKEEEITSVPFLEITDSFSVTDFEKVKTYILTKGDRKNYRAVDVNNPHYAFDGFEAFLNAESRYKNIKNDPAVSNFNEITIWDQLTVPRYYTIHIVRKGDMKNHDILILEGLEEEKVYLFNPFNNDIGEMKIRLDGFFETFRQKELADPVMELKDNFSEQEFKNALVGVWQSAFEVAGQKNIKCLQINRDGKAKATISNQGETELYEGNYTVSFLRPPSAGEITLAKITIKAASGNLILSFVEFGLHNGLPMSQELVLRINESPFGTMKRM